jgi:hypothetical protein
MKSSLRQLTFIALLLTALPFFASCIFGPPPGGPETGYTIHGFIGESPEVPAQNETVYLLDGQTDQVINDIKTNVWGNYVFSSLPPDLYIIKVRDVKWGVLIKDRNERLDIDLSQPDGTMNYLGHYVKEAFGQDGGKRRSGSGSAGNNSQGGESGYGGWPPPYRKPTGTITWEDSSPEKLLYKFAGRWDSATSNTLHNIYLKPNGTFEDTYETGYSGQFVDQGGFQTGNWGAAGNEQGGGRWTIQGNLRQGTITLISPNGERTDYKYQVHCKGGECYGGEYFFNGKLYSVKYIYR